MKKLILSLSIIVGLSSVGNAQKLGKSKISVGAELGYAINNPLSAIAGNKGWGLGAGGSFQVDHFFKENISGNFYAGIIAYGGRASGPSTKNKGYTTIPIRVGLSAYAINRIHGGLQVGVGLNSYNGASSTSFAYSPQVGYNFSRNERPLDLTLKYDGYAGHGGFGALGLRLSLFL
ncbi:MAG: hypothetical protein JSS98_00740 [Bacteroidetes bacterium]|nr:hypothetical protein [Bacteroidota bacterium]